MIHANVKEKRLEACLTQSEAAAMVYADPRTWKRWESSSMIPQAAWELFCLRTFVPNETIEPSE